MFSPYDHALTKCTWDANGEILDAFREAEGVESIEATDIEAFYRRLLSRLHFELLFHGNLTEQAAKEMMTSVLDILRPEEFKDSQTSRSKIVALPKGNRACIHYQTLILFTRIKVDLPVGC